MIQFGQTLKAAREAKGLTIQQVAETTKLMASIVDSLEKEDFSRIIVPIYGRGFVKLYCEAVGLEPKPMVEEFMNLFNAKNAPKVEATPEIKPEAPAEPKKKMAFEPNYSKEAEDAWSFPRKYLAAKHAVLRFGILGFAVLLLLLLLVCGIRALYRATTRVEENPAESAPTTQVAPMARTPKAIEPLYMD